MASSGIAEITNKGVALELRAEIYNQVATASTNEFALEQSWMRLGELLVRFEENEYWRVLGYLSFSRFMMELRDTYKRGRTQLWAYFSVAKFLLPTIPAAQLEAMGISKAMELKYALDKQKKITPGAVIPADVIAAALKKETTGKELRAMIGEAFNQTDDREPGTWYDCDGFYMTADERKEYAACVKMTIIHLGLKPEMAEHQQRKAVYTAWMQEYYGTHAAEVYGPQIENQPAQLIGAVDEKSSVG
jgi:hypothetical protein